MEEGTVDDILQHIITKRNWYQGTGMTRSDACIFKRKFLGGMASQERKRNILSKLGYEIKREIWIKKRTNQNPTQTTLQAQVVK
jgi:hypothetical protein